ncbi:MAG: formylglycine-generating enzyme family protein [Candidatus Nitrohelix vancouverensis]|uniref:Formylglycine-generating enzyme family protein n=1 Tax=Candidatus Nitrohelix vancouverensis TaxID=2705534 RepID=A0A7T0G3Z5_9BACT|nr:MAG: formylglycine-generating enzyme family protein [Candidatus Nitrohelix vancouverensis]
MKKILIPVALILLLSLSACSEQETVEPAIEGEANPALSELNIDPNAPDVDIPSSQVVPVQLSPEDKAKADKAPEGMVFIKGGCFQMGNNFAQEDEKPEHEVCVDDFYMDKYEVTQARWVKLMGGNPSRFKGDNHPVEQINFYDAQRFAEKSKGACRLPTEAEWEYAAGGKVNSRYYWGNMMDDDYAWYMDNSNATTHPVGQKKPNQFGLYDMLGNVWEWTSNWWEAPYTLSDSLKQNPTGPADGEYKTVRGGAMDSSAGALRVTNRTWLHPKNRVFPKVTLYGQTMNEIYNYIGFRCVKSVD